MKNKLQIYNKNIFTQRPVFNSAIKLSNFDHIKIFFVNFYLHQTITDVDKTTGYLDNFLYLKLKSASSLQHGERLKHRE